MVCEQDADLILSGDKLTAGVNKVIRTNVIISQPENINCKDRSQEFWINVEESLRVYDRLSLCVTEKNGVEGVPNSKLRPHKNRCWRCERKSTKETQI